MLLAVTIPLYDRGVPSGRAEYEVQGLHVQFRCELERQSLCKLELARGGKRLLLGTPAPVGKVLRLERRLSRAELERAGVWPPERVEVQGTATNIPVVEDPVPRRMFAPSYWRWQCRQDGWEVSCLWDGKGSFPAMAVVCLVSLEPRDGLWLVRCRLDGQGRPKLWGK